ncbi:phosphatase domain-containing protein [Streptomyces sp. L7]
MSEPFPASRHPGGAGVALREWGLPDAPAAAPGDRPQAGADPAHAALYRDLPFVLIGDSGQHDPEVYAQIVEGNPGGCWRSTSATSPAMPLGWRRSCGARRRRRPGGVEPGSRGRQRGRGRARRRDRLDRARRRGAGRR